jgi:hypothetical protein
MWVKKYSLLWKGSTDPDSHTEAFPREFSQAFFLIQLVSPAIPFQDQGWELP